MTSLFCISGDDAETVRLKSISANYSDRKSTIKIELEVSTAYEFGYVLRTLEDIQRDQRKALPKLARREID